MGRRRIIISRMIAEMGRDPYAVSGYPEDSSEDAESVIRAVREAVASLEAEEQVFVRQFFMEGATCVEIALGSGRGLTRIEAVRRRAIRVLRASLADLVLKRYGIESAARPECPICRHPKRPDIDRLIMLKQPDETWKPILRELRRAYGLAIDAPQTLIGHAKYHGTRISEHSEDLNRQKINNEEEHA